MDSAQFWRLIEESQLIRVEGGSAGQCKWIENRLVEMGSVACLHFYMWNEEFLGQIDNEGPVNNALDLLRHRLLGFGLSDDSSDYARSWLVLMGEKAWRNGLSDPDTLADLFYTVDPLDGESLMYVGQIAWSRAMGLDPFSDIATDSFETAYDADTTELWITDLPTMDPKYRGIVGYDLDLAVLEAAFPRIAALPPTEAAIQWMNHENVG